MSAHRILVVDDNKDFANIFCEILKTNDYMAEKCYSGSQAVEMVKNTDFDMIFLDIRMPKMDGVQALKAIKKIRPKIKAIMMTGYSVDEMIHKALEEKAFEVVYKPFEVDKILSLIRNV